MRHSVQIRKDYLSPTTKGSPLYVGDHYQISKGPEIDEPKSIKKILAPEVDIFSELPESVYQNEHANAFLNEMRKSLIKKDQGTFHGVVLPKLFLTEHTEETIVIEWIFNYFRLYFSFDKEEGDYFGEIVNIPERSFFRNFFKKMSFENFPDIAKAEINYAITLVGDGKK